MLKTFIVVAIAIGIRPTIAEACGNTIEWTTNDYVKVLVRAEKWLDKGDPGVALRVMRDVTFTGDRAQRTRLQPRAKDIAMLIKLRMELDLERVAMHFQARVEQIPKSVRHRAWLAEAYVAVGKPELARPIFDDLVARDVMPDAWAYLALGKITTGHERLAAWKACRVRMTHRYLCEMPNIQARR